MKIGVISDTHLSRPTEELRNVVTGPLADVDLVLHAGDLTRLAVLDAFAGKELIAVAGNRDRAPVRDHLPTHTVVKAQGYRIGLMHGSGSPRGIEARMLDMFPDVHCIVFGHTHRPMNRIYNGVLMFNPGPFSRCLPFFHRRSIGVLTIGGGLRGTILTADKWFG